MGVLCPSQPPIHFEPRQKLITAHIIEQDVCLISLGLPYKVIYLKINEVTRRGDARTPPPPLFHVGTPFCFRGR